MVQTPTKTSRLDAQSAEICGDRNDVRTNEADRLNKELPICSGVQLAQQPHGYCGQRFPYGPSARNREGDTDCAGEGIPRSLDPQCSGNRAHEPLRASGSIEMI